MSSAGLEDDLRKVHDFVDDDLLSCFLWAAGENAVAQPGWESPSVTPLQGIPLPPDMPLDGGDDADGGMGGLPPLQTETSSRAVGSMLGGGGMSKRKKVSERDFEAAGSPAAASSDGNDEDGLGVIKDLDDSDSAHSPLRPGRAARSAVPRLPADAPRPLPLGCRLPCRRERAAAPCPCHVHR